MPAIDDAHSGDGVGLSRIATALVQTVVSPIHISRT